jgi:hypothetical protein
MKRVLWDQHIQTYLNRSWNLLGGILVEDISASPVFLRTSANIQVSS